MSYLLAPRGKIPDYSLQAATWIGIKKTGKRSRFRMVGPGKV